MNNSETDPSIFSIPKKRWKKVILVDKYGEIVAGPGKAVGPVESVETSDGPMKQVRFYGKKEFLPAVNPARFNAMFTLDGKQLI